MSLIYWDTMLFIYLWETDSNHLARTKEIRERMLDRGDFLCTSLLTVGELLTGCYKRGQRDLASQIREALRPPAVEVLPFTLEVAERYAHIRAQHRLTPADAIHLATAAVSKVNLFLTNDRKLAKLTIPGIDFIAGLDVNVF